MDECGEERPFCKKTGWVSLFGGGHCLVVANGKPSPILDNIFWLLNS
jgi:hypothetical protein